MKISKDSWHYKALTQKLLFLEGKSSYEVCSSLCGYFWQVAWRIISVFVLYLIALSPLVFWPSLLLELPPANMLHAFLGAVGMLATGGYAFIALIVVLYVISEYVLTPLFNRVGKGEKEKEPSLILSYIKAKHSKVCPVLEFTDAE